MFTWFPYLINVTVLVTTVLVVLALFALVFRLARGERLLLAMFGGILALLDVPYSLLAGAVELVTGAMRHMLAGLLAMAPEGRRSEVGVLGWYLVMPLLVVALGALLAGTGVALDAVRFSGILGGAAVASDPASLGTELAIAYGLGGILSVLLLADAYGHSVLGRGASMWFSHLDGRMLKVARQGALATFALYLASAVFLAIWSSSPDASLASSAFLFCYVLALVGIVMLAGVALAHCVQALLVVVLALCWLGVILLRTALAVPVRVIEGLRDVLLMVLAVLADIAMLVFDRERRRLPAAQAPGDDVVTPAALPAPLVLHRGVESGSTTVQHVVADHQDRQPA